MTQVGTLFHLLATVMLHSIHHLQKCDVDFCRFQAAFDDIALFFYDVYGSNYIGVVWKPSAAETENQIKV